MTLTLFWIHMHKIVAFDFLHESKFPIYRWFRDKIGYSSLFKDIPPIIPAYQYSDRMILMELSQSRLQDHLCVVHWNSSLSDFSRKSDFYPINTEKRSYGINEFLHWRKTHFLEISIIKMIQIR